MSPIKDPERKREVMKAWRERVMAQGYGKWLYERRKLRFDDAERFRAALEEIASMVPNAGNLDTQPVGIAQRVLEESRKAEEDLGRWQGQKGENENSSLKKKRKKLRKQLTDK